MDLAVTWGGGREDAGEVVLVAVENPPAQHVEGEIAEHLAI